MSASAKCEGAELRLLSFDGKWLVLEGARAWAPGSPMKIEAELGEEKHALDARSLGSQRQPDGSFRVKTRMVSLTRASRAALVTHLDSTPSV